MQGQRLVRFLLSKSVCSGAPGRFRCDFFLSTTKMIIVISEIWSKLLLISSFCEDDQIFVFCAPVSTSVCALGHMTQGRRGQEVIPAPAYRG
jgi:hypothetical protein